MCQRRQSRVLNDDARISARTRDRVTSAAIELGYVGSFSASSLASGRNSNISVLLPGLNSWFFSSVVERISASLLKERFDLTLYNSGGGTRHGALFDDFLLRRRVDAIIVVASKLSTDEIARLLTIRMPAVVVGGSAPGISTISIDETAASAAATAHLVDLGHQRIAHVSGLVDDGPSFSTSTRHREGYEATMNQVDLRVLKQWIVSAKSTVAGGYEAAMRLLVLPTQERPSAILSSSDEMAVGVIFAAKEFGFTVPGDLSVIGIDGNELGEAFSLTTVNQFAQEQGRRAVQHLRAQLCAPRTEYVSSNEIFSSKLIPRSSTGAPCRPEIGRIAAISSER